MRLFRQGRSSQQGFTLIELVSSLVLLSIVMVGIGGIIKLASQIYLESTSREQLVSNARFAVERLNRELRNALPNSLRITTDASQACLEFYPIVASAVYLDNFPISPKPAATTGTVVFPDVAPAGNLCQNAITGSNLQAVIYPLHGNELYDGTSGRMTYIGNIQTTANNECQLTFANSNGVVNAFQFTQQSANQRVFIVSSPVSYCAKNSAGFEGELWRHTGYSPNGNQTPSNAGVLMAEHLYLADSNGQARYPFYLDVAHLKIHAMVALEFEFRRYDESIIFHNEVQVQNVP